MKASKEGATKSGSAELQIKSFVAKYEPKHRALFHSVRKAMRKRFPSANELVYDYPSSCVIGYSPTERGLEAVVAISAGADGVRLIFNQGPALPDPKKILLGSAKLTRYIQIESSRTLIRPEVQALLEAAHDRAKTSLSPGGRGKLIIKPSSARKRPGKRQN